MRRILIVMAAIPVGAAIGPAMAGASTPRAKLELRHTRVGTILVNGRGFTVYAYSADRPNRDNCQNRPACLTVWPAVKTSAKAIAGPGVRASLIGTITLKNGVRQVTYAGHPLYTYVADTSPGQTSYVGRFQLGGFWPAVNAAGREVK